MLKKTNIFSAFQGTVAVECHVPFYLLKSCRAVATWEGGGFVGLHTRKSRRVITQKKKKRKKSKLIGSIKSFMNEDEEKM
jgi:hypothetical protein